MKRKYFLIPLLLFAIWVCRDFFVSLKTDIRDFDPVQRGSNEAAMWRSYYEREPLRLFWQLSRSLRQQYHIPFWRSFSTAYQAAKASFVFKEGSSRDDYQRALPYLIKFYADIHDFSTRTFSVEEVASLELEWWIIRREPHLFKPADWEAVLSQQAHALYHIHPDKTRDYAHIRTHAMQIRDSLSTNIRDSDWELLDNMLIESWSLLKDSLTVKK
jgi:hypothetical protein